MENLLGFIIFVVIVAVSIINKIRNEAKEAQEAVEKRERPATFDDLPEATRQMLYGERGRDIIVAKPRKPGSERPAAPPSPHPVSGRQVEYEQTPPPVTPGPQMQQPQQPPRPIYTPQQHPESVRPAVTSTRQPLQQTMRQQPRQQQPTRVKPATPPKPVRQPARTQPTTARKPTTAPVRKTRPQGATARGAAGLADLLSSRHELARSIVVREILGPPKAFEDYV